MSPDQLADVSIRVLEEAAFVFAEPANGPIEFVGEVIAAHMNIRGDRVGSIGLRLPRELASRTAASLLCGPPEEAEEAAAPMVGELLNVLAGAVVAAEWGEEVRCSLVPPEIEPFDLPEGPRGTHVILVTLEGDRIDIEFAA